jgi:hypothetical protein
MRSAAHRVTSWTGYHWSFLTQSNEGLQGLEMNMPDASEALFERAFPTLEDVEFTVRLLGKNPTPRPQVFTKQNWPGNYIRCSNVHCRDGGFKIGDIVARMVSEARTHEKIDTLCLGHEEVAGSRGRGPKCQNRLSSEIRITFRKDPSAGSGS